MKLIIILLLLDGDSRETPPPSPPPSSSRGRHSRKPKEAWEGHDPPPYHRDGHAYNMPHPPGEYPHRRGNPAHFVSANLTVSVIPFRHAPSAPSRLYATPRKRRVPSWGPTTIPGKYFPNFLIKKKLINQFTVLGIIIIIFNYF